MKTLLKILAGVVAVLVLVVAGLVLSVRSNVPSEHFPVSAAVGGPDDIRPVLIFGATRNLGLEIVRLLRERGQSVTVAVRPSSDRSQVAPLGVDFVVADAMDAEAVDAAVGGADYQAVITTVGCFRCEPPPDFIGNRNIIDAAAKHDVDRFILITSLGAGDSAEHTNLLSRIVLRKILPLKTLAEDHLRETDLAYTIIRPGGLLSNDRAPSGNGQLYDDRTAFGFIHRADVAALTVAALDDPRAIGKTLGAIDPNVDTPF